MYVCAYIHTCVRMYVCAYIHTCVRMYVCAYIYTCVRMYVCAYIHTCVRMYNGLCCHGKGTTLAYTVVLLRDGEGNAVHNTILPQQWADTIQGPLHNNISVVCKLNTSNTENLQEVSFCDYYARQLTANQMPILKGRTLSMATQLHYSVPSQASTSTGVHS